MHPKDTDDHRRIWLLQILHLIELWLSNVHKVLHDYDISHHKSIFERYVFTKASRNGEISNGFQIDRAFISFFPIVQLNQTMHE
jgi:hypothetical protein